MIMFWQGGRVGLVTNLPLPWLRLTLLSYGARLRNILTLSPGGETRASSSLALVK